MVGFDHAVFGAYGCSLNQRQEVSLNTFTRNIAAAAVIFACYLVYLINKDNAVIFYGFDGCLNNSIIIQKFVAFFFHQNFISITNRHLTCFIFVAERFAQ